MKKVKTLQVGNKLLILNGIDPLRYLDLKTNKIHQYAPIKINLKRQASKLFNRKKHVHDWLIVKDNIRFRERDGTEFVIDFYRCECGAGSRVKTPKAEYDKGNKAVEIAEDREDKI